MPYDSYSIFLIVFFPVYSVTNRFRSTFSVYLWKPVILTQIDLVVTTFDTIIET